MLKITIPEMEYFDGIENFIHRKPVSLQLEHSLVSISKWESKWNKPFLSEEKKTKEEVIDYIRCMTLTQNVNPEVYCEIPDDIMDEINAYIDSPMTATWFNERSENSKKIVITSELIYYWMIQFGIPSEYQKWHLNRLITLIRVCSIKQSSEKMSKNEVYRSNKELNEARKAKLKTKG